MNFDFFVGSKMNFSSLGDVRLGSLRKPYYVRPPKTAEKWRDFDLVLFEVAIYSISTREMV